MATASQKSTPWRYSITEARSRFAEIVDEAARGTRVVLTRRGEPVAVVVSPREIDAVRRKRQLFGDAYRRFLQDYPLNEIGLNASQTAFRRNSTEGRKVRL